MTVSNLSSVEPEISNLQEFFGFIYSDSEGYACCPTKDPETGVYRNYTFSWPSEKEELVKHIKSFTKTHEIYYSPALFSEPSDKKEYFKCSNVVWVEFDEEEEIQLQGDIPEPTLKLQSSTTGHEHWYWKLNFKITEAPILERITKRLVYALKADFGWAANKVLRPIETNHHESHEKVKILELNNNIYGPEAFIALPDVPKDIDDLDIGSVPDVSEVIAIHQWSKEDFKFFRKGSQKKGSRSSALSRLGSTCIEMGLTNEETLSILLNADSRWKKFVGREDQRKQLISIIKYCRLKYGNKEAELESRKLKIYSFEEFCKVERNIEWIVEGYFWKKCVAMIAGPPEVGKSQFIIRLAMYMAMGKKFINWDIKKPIRTMFLSLEMSHEALKLLTDTMTQNLSDEERELINKSFFIWSGGYGLSMDNADDQKLILDAIKEYKPEAVFIDSLTKATRDDINSNTTIDNVVNFIKRDIFSITGSLVCFIHHNRKGQVGNKKPKSLDDLYGSRFIAADMDTVIALWPVGDEIELLELKTRLAKKSNQQIFIKRTETIDFTQGRIRTRPTITPSTTSEDNEDEFLGF